MNPPSGGDGSKEMAEFYKHKNEFVNFAKKIPSMKPGKTGSMTRMMLFQTHTLFMTGSRAFAALWLTPPGRYLAVAIAAGGMFYNYRQAQLERMKNDTLLKQKEAERIKQDTAVKEAQLKLAQYEQQLKTFENDKKSFEDKMTKEVTELKTLNQNLQKHFEESQTSWFSWLPFFKKK